jgi:hypothetical protein
MRLLLCLIHKFFNPYRRMKKKFKKYRIFAEKRELVGVKDKFKKRLNSFVGNNTFKKLEVFIQKNIE